MYLKFLKLSRLLIPSAWKNLKWGDTVAYIICLIGSIIISNLNDRIFIYSGQIICIGACMSIVLQVLHDVCCPREIVKLCNGRIKVGVYKSQTLHKHNLFDIIIRKEGYERIIFAAEYAFPFKNPDACCFTFRPAKDDNRDWLVWNAKTEEATVLGKKLNKILFISPEEELHLKILQANGSLCKITGDYMVYDEFHIPKGALLAYADNFPDPQIPDKFLFVCQKDVYKSYGFYLQEDEPKWREIILSSVIFREGKDKILLQYDEDKACYQEICRYLELFRRLDEYFIEFTENYRIGGNIYRYDGKHEKLDKIYEGNFRIIDFNEGKILGDNGKIYGR